MDENEAVDQQGLGAATPIFGVYRRGYDPEQVDRYVADQQRRLDESTHRASESERKLAAAVGQLRELHRRVAVYESEARSTQPPALDTLGERVQRILQEAWEGAYNLRQEAEREVNELKDQTQREVEAQRQKVQEDVEELRQVASREAADLVDEATRRALALRDEMDHRRGLYLEKVERDRQGAVSQITFLYDQRQLALSELARLQTTIQATVEEMVRSPLGKPSAAIADSATVRTERDEVGVPDPRVEASSRGDVGLELTMAADEQARPGDEVLEEADAFPEPVFVEAPDVRAMDETLVGTRDGGSWVPDAGLAPGVEETPTGPMNAVDYGYDYASYSNRPAHAQGGGAYQATLEPDPGEPFLAAAPPDATGDETKEAARGRDGVFDAEVDAWG